MIGLLLIALGGALGSVLRFGVITLTYKFFDIHFPWGTIFANLTGCFVIGVIWAILDTFDMLSPAYDLPLTEACARRSLEKEGIQNITRLSNDGLNVGGVLV